MTGEQNPHPFDVVVVGGGAAGLGVAIALTHAGIENFLVLERHQVGASFAAWPEETRFITPSFASNSAGLLDLNSIAIGVSPAFSLEAEHPTGQEYAEHLKGVAELFDLPIREETEVRQITKVGEEFHIDTAEETVRAKHLIWAAGEFQYPNVNGFLGSDLCKHTATVERYEDLEGDDFIIVGGYESGVDAAYHLASRGKRVRLFDSGSPWRNDHSDPSIALSTYSLERMRTHAFETFVELHAQTSVTAVIHTASAYILTTSGRQFQTSVPPLLAGGFDGSHKRVAHLFELRPDGYPRLSTHDESTLVPGVFLCGPAVRQEHHVFCFIYKYRQRFAVVAKAIATSLGLPAKGLETYREWGMYLDDLSVRREACSAC